MYYNALFHMIILLRIIFAILIELKPSGYANLAKSVSVFGIIFCNSLLSMFLVNIFLIPSYLNTANVRSNIFFTTQSKLVS